MPQISKYKAQFQTIFIQVLDYVIDHQQTGCKPVRRRRRRKRLQHGTALINAGSPTPTAPTNQPAGNIGDSRGPHPSVAVNLIDLDLPATTPSASGEIQGLMANLDIRYLV